jgi:hypothetical protein
VHVLAAAIGAYVFATGSVVSLVPQNGGLRYVDYASGALRQLTPESARVLDGGPGVSVSKPVTVRLRLDNGALWRDGKRARGVPLVSEDVSYRSGSVRIAARVLHPQGRGPFPAVVVVPGSVPAHRTTYDLWAYFYASHGFAVLTYDKRGVGDSTGRYVRAATTSNLRDQAGDALAGVAFLHRRSDVKRIGLTGGSQAGWTIALAASRSPAVSFAAIQAGAVMPVGRQLAYSALTHGGSAAPSQDRIDATLANAPDTGFDPRPALASLHIPVLWQLGSLDRRMYTPEAVEDIDAITGHDFTVHVYDGGAHSLRLTEHGTSAEESTSPGFAVGVFGDLAAWLRSRVTAR